MRMTCEQLLMLLLVWEQIYWRVLIFHPSNLGPIASCSRQQMKRCLDSISLMINYCVGTRTNRKRHHSWRVNSKRRIVNFKNLQQLMDLRACITIDIFTQSCKKKWRGLGGISTVFHLLCLIWMISNT